MGDKWREVTLGDVLELHRGHDLPERDRRAGAVPIVSSAGISDFHDTAAVQGPGVITGRYGTIGKVYFINKDFWPLNTTLYVSNFRGNDPLFASYLLKTIDYQSCSDKAAVPGVNRNHLHELEVLLPPLPEQRAIAHILGTLDDKIELNRRMSETLEAMARTLFKSWFVDFDPVQAKMEGRWGKGESLPGLPADLWQVFPDRLVDSELGEIPEGWEVREFKDVLTELEVGSRPRGGVAAYSHGVPSIGAESIVGLGVFDYVKTKYVPRAYFMKMTKGHIKNRDVLLYKDGGRPGEFEPHVTLFGEDFPFREAAINEHVYRLRVKPDVGQEFLFFWLSSELVMEEMRIKGTGVAIPGLNSTQVKSLTILVPSRLVTCAFSKIVKPLITQVLSSCKESRTLSSLRDTLLPKLISGEIRVKDADKFVERAV